MARKKEEDANEQLEQLLPRLEATVATLTDSDELLTVESIIARVVQDGDLGEVGRKIIKYQAKERAI